MAKKDSDLESWASRVIKNFFYIGGVFSIIRSLAIVITQPAEVIRINEQVNLNNHTYRVMKEIYQREGMRGFYRGTIPSIIKIVFKEMYRGPTMAFVPLILDTYIFSKKTDNKYIHTVCFVPIFTLIDTCMSAPLDRLKMLQITSGNKGLFATIKRIANKEMFRGFNKIYLHNLSSWGIFFLIDDLVKNNFKSKKSFAIHYTNIICGCCVGLFNTPLSMLVTHYTKDNPLQGITPWSFFRRTIQEKGTGIIFCGWKGRVYQSIIGGAITSGLRDWSHHQVIEEELSSENLPELPKQR